MSDDTEPIESEASIQAWRAQSREVMKRWSPQQWEVRAMIVEALGEEHRVTAEDERLAERYITLGGGAVYFIQAISGGPIKIGRVNGSVHRRLKRIQACCPVQLRVLACLPGGPGVEAGLHRYFEHSRLHGEWFEPSKHLLDIIAEAAEGAPWIP